MLIPIWLVTGDTFESWLLIAPSRLPRIAPALLYVQTPDQPAKWLHVDNSKNTIIMVTDMIHGCRPLPLNYFRSFPDIRLKSVCCAVNGQKSG